MLYLYSDYYYLSKKINENLTTLPITITSIIT